MLAGVGRLMSPRWNGYTRLPRAAQSAAAADTANAVSVPSRSSRSARSMLLSPIVAGSSGCAMPPCRRGRLTVRVGATLWRMQNVRVGVIGVGGMGSFHAHTLASLAHVDLVSVADPFQPNVDKLTAALGCEGLADPMALATDASLDAVVIASPDATHADLAIAAMHTGSWVLCEKPLATTMADAWRVVEAESALGSRRIQLGFMRE